MRPEISDLEAILDHTFADKQMLLSAISTSTIASMMNSAVLSQGGELLRPTESNARLAFLGAKVLGLIITEKAITDGKSKAEMDGIIKEMASAEKLHTVGTTKELEKHLFRDPSQTTDSKKVMATAVEAIIGAAYLDGGMEAAKTIVSAFYEE